MIHNLRAMAAKLRGLFGDHRANQEFDDEIEAHLRLLAERYIRQGMTEEEAAWAARRGSLKAFTDQRRELLRALKGLAIKDWSRSATFTATTKRREQTVFSYACRIAEHENKHCDQIEAVLKIASEQNSGVRQSARVDVHSDPKATSRSR